MLEKVKSYVLRILITACFTQLYITRLAAGATDYSAEFSGVANLRSFNGSWIGPDRIVSKPGVFLFRKTFNLPNKPGSFKINVSADNRYRLFVNGNPVCFGPARGDTQNWYFETLDIAPLLKKGKNVISAVVWNFANAAPDAQMSIHTAFIIFTSSGPEKAAATNSSWKVMEDKGWSWANRRTILLVGNPEKIDGSKHLWGWEKPEFDDSAWPKAEVVNMGYGAIGNSYGQRVWGLVARDIPMMEESPTEFREVRRATGGIEAENIIKKKPLKIPSNTKCKILLDQGYLTTAYPEMLLSGGKGAEVKVNYAENLYDKKGEKGNRNEIDGKDFSQDPYADIFLPDGASNRLYRPLWMRTYRYVQLEISTADDPLVLEKYGAVYTGYPFKEKGSFESNDDSLAKIWEVGWRTARLCAHETYFDCPFYEQLQYVGDTRIQALISLYVSGDSRLMRKAILTFDLSRDPMGLTRSRYPSRRSQFIPPFSLIWINMLSDYQRHVDDAEFVKDRLDGVRAVISWYEKQIDARTGFLKPNLPFWNFVDWVRTWPRGVPPETEDSGSALHSLHLVYALEAASNLMKTYGFDADAKKYSDFASRVKKSVYEKCWDPARGILRDCADDDYFSQHTNALGILTDTIPLSDQLGVFEKITENPLPNVGRLRVGDKAVKTGRINEATFYYKFYLVRAMKKVGLGDRYVDMLSPWSEMIDKGLTTFPENPDPCRSECHAWSSSPNYDFLATVCGVEPDSDAFKSVKVEPHLGSLKYVRGKVPHKLGFIEVDLQRSENGDITGRVILPEGLSGRFVNKGAQIGLKSGINKIGK